MFRAIRIVATVLMALTAFVTLASGIGTFCAAFFPEKYGEMMAALIPYKWLYQSLVVVTVGAGLAGLWVTYGLARGRRWSYGGALITLLAIIGFALVQITASRLLRGKSMPNDLRLYAALFTLLIFLLLRIPGVWKRAGFDNGADSPGPRATAAGLSLFVCGLAAIGTPVWAGPSHFFEGYNLVNVLWLPLTLAGVVMTLAGICLLVLPPVGRRYRREILATR